MDLRIYQGILGVVRDVLLAAAPLAVVFLISQFWFLKYRKSQLVRLFKGTLIALFGLTLFLQGINFGFIEVAGEVGRALGGLSFSWVVIPIGFVLGLATTLADPSIYVLVKEVEDSSGSAIPRKLLLIALCVGVGGAIALTMVRLMFDFSFLWIIIPGYILAVFLTYFIEADFAAMSFDSGGVVTGTMIASFVLPFASGVSEGLGRGNEGFGIVGFVALIPILTMLTIGLLLRVRRQRRRV
ncbi:MAG: DUF1538 domain-containing protein [Alkalispirochaeta sp.]|jgi:hypothetical protein